MGDKIFDSKEVELNKKLNVGLIINVALLRYSHQAIA